VNTESKTGTANLKVTAEADGSRLDIFIGQALRLSRAQVKKLFEQGAIRVDGRRSKKGEAVKVGQSVRVLLGPADHSVRPDPDAPLSVLLADAALVFLDKPAGMPSHPLEAGESGTLANALVARFPECATAAADPREGGLCHRLDVETSGVIVAARNPEAWRQMRRAFTRGEIDKRYLALVGGPIADEGEIDVPLRHRAGRGTGVKPALAGEAGARRAESMFRVLARSSDCALVEVRIITGVLHQVRAHLAAVGAPVVGDALYGGRTDPALSRFFLHARSLELSHPQTQARLKVASPIPEDLSRVLGRLGIPAV
jgi:23S rRNA pseudouridine1911/1915/1917 synthase